MHLITYQEIRSVIFCHLNQFPPKCYSDFFIKILGKYSQHNNSDQTIFLTAHLTGGETVVFWGLVIAQARAGALRITNQTLQNPYTIGLCYYRTPST